MNPEQDFVMKTIESRDVHFVRFWFTDVLGSMKSVAVIPSELEDAFADGMGFDASCIEGFSDTRESDMLMFPEASTFQILPWRPTSNAVARMFCNIKTPDGVAFAGDPRQVLRRVVCKANDMGYVYNVGPELEFFYFRNSEGTEVLDRGGYYDTTSLDGASDLRRNTVFTLEKMGIPVEYSHHERGPSQYEIDLRHTDALSMADAVMTYKMVVKEIAKLHGLYATFMPKPMADAPGSGMHVHQSLYDFDGNNLFYDPNDPLGYSLSDTAKHFIAGILKYAPEFCLVTNQYVNSYKRFTSGDCPVALAWGKGTRSVAVRIPGYRPNRESACRIELRTPDPSANPYLAFAVMLASGLKGIEDELELCAPIDACDLSQLSRRELKDMGIETMPTTLGEAVELFADSEFMRETLGEYIHDYLVKAKRAEWNEYLKEVTPWETNRYLAVL